MNVTYLTFLILLVIYFITRKSGNTETNYLVIIITGIVLILYDSYMTMGNKYLKL